MTDEPLPEILGADPEQAIQVLVERLVTSIGADNPALQELLMIAALPRTFDAPLLATLTGQDQSDPGFADTFSKLIASTFVAERGKGMYAMHDSIRSPLLLRWRDRADRDENLRKLLGYHDSRYQHALRLSASLDYVSEVVHRANFRRWSAATEHIEDLLIRPAIEALHVALMISPNQGWDQLLATFTEFEAKSRYQLCGMLVRAFAEDIGNVPEEARAAHKGWSAYFDARLANDRRRWTEAGQYLLQIERPEEIDIKLAGWLYSEKARSLRGRYLFDEALTVLDRIIALDDQYKTDPWNAWLSWANKAENYQMRWDQDHEVAALREAERLAAEARNVPAQISSKIRLVSALTVLGDLESATGTLLETVRMARLEQDLDVSASLVVTAGVLSCLGPRSARLLDAMATEYRQLAQLYWPTGELDLLLIEAEALISGGNAPAAAARFDAARNLASENLPDRVWEVDADRGANAELLGEPRLGAELNLKLLRQQELAADKWSTARCLTNAATAMLAAGKFSEGLQRIAEARQVFVSMNHERAVSFTWATEAELRRHLGDLDGAHKAMAQASGISARGYELDYYICAARLALDCADYDEAVAQSRNAIAVRAVSGRKMTLDALLLATESLTAGRLYAEAAQISVRIQELLNELDAFSTWKATDKTRLADEHAARAVRIMTAGRGSYTSRLRAAREHLEMATRLDPEFGWFHVELAIVHLGLGQQRQAVRSLAEAARLTSDPALNAGINQMRGEIEGPQANGNH